MKLGFGGALLICWSLVLCGCGRGGGEGAAPKPPEAPAAAPATPTDTAAAPAERPSVDVSKAPEVPADASVRRPAVAGQFYPGDEAALRKDVTARLQRAGKTPELPGKLRAIIVPHAGYTYSADTAAAAFAGVKGRGFDRAVLLGGPHRLRVRSVSVADADFFQTPLGPVKVDTEFAKQLAAKAGPTDGPAAHAGEHSLEVELPFLQTVIGPGVRIVPVLIIDSPAAEEKLARALSELLDERTLLVVSTDMAHYPTQQVAEKVNAETVESWKTLDVEKVEAVERKLLAAGHEELDCTMCGGGAVKTLMRLAPLLGIDSVTILKTDTSATAGGEKTRVVGYASAAFCASGKKAPAAAAKPADDLAKPKALSAVDGPPEISAQSRKKLLEIARAAATAAAGGKRAPELDAKSLPADLRVPGGAFVTLKNKGELRGCIGRYPCELSVAEVVREMGGEAARDDRFVDQPVTVAEMKSIDIEISVLSPLVRIDDWRKIKLGVHGVILKRGWNSGVFLPQVATETGWTLEEFLGHLARDKARLPANAYKDPDTEIRVFTALVFGEKEH